MDSSNDEKQKQPVLNDHLKSLFGLDNDYQAYYFEEIQRKYWESLKPANDNIEVKRGDND